MRDRILNGDAKVGNPTMQLPDNVEYPCCPKDATVLGRSGTVDDPAGLGTHPIPGPILGLEAGSRVRDPRSGVPGPGTPDLGSQDPSVVHL